jgi:hypothetical protein
MKNSFYCLLFATLFLISCKEDQQARQRENLKDTQKKTIVFNTINSKWNFNTQPINPAAQGAVTIWSEWRILMDELDQKPKSTIGAFQQKAKTLSKKAIDLNKNIPIAYNKPEVKSRISVLITKINALELFINLQAIPADKVVGLIQEINNQIRSIQTQLGEIVRKSTIPKEEGETDMIKMLDTARAIPSNQNTKNFPKN